MQDAVLPLSAAAMALPPISIRGDLGVLSTAGARYSLSCLKSFIQMGPQGAVGATKLLRPFSEIVDSLGLKHPFVRNWVDLLCFLLAGVKSDGTLSAEIVSFFSFVSVIFWDVQLHLFSSLLSDSFMPTKHQCKNRKMLLPIHNNLDIPN